MRTASTCRRRSPAGGAAGARALRRDVRAAARLRLESAAHDPGGGWKYIDAPTPELYDLARDPGETTQSVAQQREPRVGAGRAARVDADRRPRPPAATPRALGSAKRWRGCRHSGTRGGRAPAAARLAPDPKDRRRDRRALRAGRVGRTAGGGARARAARDPRAPIPRNPQANVRLGYVLLDSRPLPPRPRPRFSAAIAAHLPSADAHLGLAACQLAAKDTAGALAHAARRPSSSSPTTRS